MTQYWITNLSHHWVNMSIESTMNQLIESSFTLIEIILIVSLLRQLNDSILSQFQLKSNRPINLGTVTSLIGQCAMIRPISEKWSLHPKIDPNSSKIHIFGGIPPKIWIFNNYLLVLGKSRERRPLIQHDDVQTQKIIYDSTRKTPHVVEIKPGFSPDERTAPCELTPELFW